MKQCREERRPIPFVRIAIIIAVIAVIAAAVGMFIHERRVNTVKSVEDAYSIDAFIYGGETYRLDSTAAGDKTVLRPMSAPEEYLILPGKRALWADAIDRLVYMDGSKVKTCDVNGENRETVFQVSGFRYVAVIMDIIDDYVLVNRTYYLRGSAYADTGDYFLVNLITGESVEIQVAVRRGISALCIADGFFYYGTSDYTISGVNAKSSDMYRDICRCNLETGELEILTDHIGAGDGESLDDCGCVIDGYLYFILYPFPASLLRVPITGGDVEQVDGSSLDLAQYGTRGITRIVGDGGRVLVAYNCQEDGAGYSTKVFAFDPAGGELRELLDWPTAEQDSTFMQFKVQGDTLLVCCWGGTVLQAELA